MQIIINNEANATRDLDNCLWYGGLVASIETEFGVYEIVARGIVDCELIAKKDYIDEYGNEYKKGDLIVRVKDKNEDGLFERELKQYIKNDERLDKIICEQDEEFELVFNNNNWLELSFCNPSNEYEEEVILDDSSILSAIDTVIDLLKEKREFKDNKYSVYCRTASFSKSAIQNQRELCLKQMEVNNIKVHESDVNIYIDNGFSSTDTFPPALNLLFNDIKEGKESLVITPDLTRISRSILKMFDVRIKLEENNSDIYLVKEKEYIHKDFFARVTIPQLSNILCQNLENENIVEEPEIEMG